MLSSGRTLQRERRRGGSRRLRLAGLLLMCTGVVSGCIDGESATPAAPSSIQASITPSPETTTGGEERSSTSPSDARQAAPASLEEYEARWERERRAIIDELNSGGYGLDDDGVLRGPGGFSLDTNGCPEGWSNDAGSTPDAITIVQLAPLSALTTIGDLGRGAQAYFEFVNENGGVGPDGVRVEFELRDDAYVPEQTRQIIEELVSGPQPLAVSTLGTQTLEAVNDLVNEACLPLVMGITASPIWADPANHPWTTGVRMAQSTEALLWLEWIERSVDTPVMVAALVMDNSFGRTYETAFAEAAAGSDAIDRFEVVRHDPAASSVENELAEIVGLEPDVFISMTAGNPCLLAIEAADREDLDSLATIRFTPSACAQVEAYMKPAGSAGDEWMLVAGGIRDASGTVWADDPWVSFVNRELEAAGVDTDFGEQPEGFGFRGWAMHQVLEIAANLDGGLTRTNLILAQRGLTTMTHPMLHPGITFGMNGSKDAYPIEGSQISRYDAQTHSWIVEEVIDINEATPPCAWRPDIGCRQAN